MNLALLRDYMREEQSHKAEIIPFNHFTIREYQRELFYHLRQKKHKHYIVVAHRDYGKDIVVFNHVLYEMYEVPGTYHYVFQNLEAAKGAIWEAITDSGESLMSYVPEDLIIQKNRNELFIKLKTRCGRWSTLKFISSINYDGKRGVKIQGVVFSESAYCHPGIFEVYKPLIRNRQDCWEIHVSTPFGNNHFYDLYEMAKVNPDWFVGFYPIDVTGKLTKEDMDKERARGTSEEMIQQEYYCKFNRGAEGSFYAKYMQAAYLSGRIGDYTWDSSLPVYTAWDLGLSNNRIIFFQLKGNNIYVIDACDDTDGGLENRINYILAKPYTVSMNYLPHDGEGKEARRGETVRMVLEDGGLKVDCLKRGSFVARIETTRANFSRIRINRECTQLIEDLRNYRQVFDKQRNCYVGLPVKDGPDHYADAFGLMVIASKEIEEDGDEEEYKKGERAYYQYNYGHRGNHAIPNIHSFR